MNKEELIRFGNFLISPDSQKELMSFEVEEEIKKLGYGWRICKKEEFKYILKILFNYRIGKKFGFKEGDRINKDGKIYDPLYSFEEGGIFYVYEDQLFSISPSYDIDDFTLNYIFVKDI